MEGLTRAPRLNRSGLEWLNVDAPLDLADLRGKLVILDFWTYCCINCMHMIPTLTRIEEKFPDSVVVIGVHSPKFAAERDIANVRAAIKRLGMHHPVIHDPNMVLWREYAVRAWPTLTFISPDGMVIGNMQGEARAENLILGVGNMLREWQSAGILSPAPLKLSSPPETNRRFLFPGKIKPLPGANKRWVLADSGHHQIVILNDDGAEVERIGSGAPGFLDADKTTAAFSTPQGLVADEHAIYVADTGNHALRRIDRNDFSVTTMAGTGARGLILGAAQPGSETALASPWDVECDGDTLYIANAGTHQIGALDIPTGTVRALAGTGGENIVDGNATDALLAQPSGLTLSADRKTLFIADSETSAVRALSLAPENETLPHLDTLIGAGLFDFGTACGPFEVARLQHPLGLTVMGTDVIVADSFNDRLCRLDLDKRRMEARSIPDMTCAEGLCLPLGEPAGVAWDRESPQMGRLLVSDSNNHRVLEVDWTAERVRTWAD